MTEMTKVKGIKIIETKSGIVYVKCINDKFFYQILKTLNSKDKDYIMC